jgi:RND family efflux transporter MFP subunit
MKIMDWIRLTVGMVAVTIGGCHQDPPRVNDQPATRRVSVDSPKVKDLVRECEQPGKVEAYEQTPIHSRVTGYVRSVLVDIGDRVKIGQPLLELDVPDLVEQVRQKESRAQEALASTAQAKAAIASAEAMVETSQALLVESKAALQRTEAELARAKSDLERTEQLASTSAVSPKIVDEARSVYQAAAASKEESQAKIRSQEALLRESQTKVDQSGADFETAVARSKTIAAELAESRAMLAYATLQSPFDGMVTERHVHTGHLVEPGRQESKPLLVVSRIDPIRVVVDVPEIDAALIDVADKVFVRIQAFGPKVIQAEVSRISWSLHATSRTLRAEVDLPNPAGDLRPGMYAYARIILEESPAACTLPISALKFDGAQAYCFVVRGGHVHRTNVTLGLRAGKESSIKEGLAPTDQVVIAGVDTLTDGQPIEPMPVSPKP